MDLVNRRIKLIATVVLITLLLTIVLLVTLLGGKGPDPASKPAKLLLVSLDGFHYRYLQLFPNETRFLREHFADNGVHAERGMKSVFATKTFAIHWTMATGLYEESHGILGNNFYDPLFNETFSCKTANQSKWFDGEPIWSVAQKQGRKVGVSQWMGSAAQFPDDRQSPNLLDPHKTCHSASDVRKKLKIVRNYMYEQGADFTMLYFHEPDNSGHWYGAASDVVRQVLAEIDAAVEEFVTSLPDSNINIIILSDHGMRNITRVVYLDDKLPVGEKMDDMTDYADAGGIIMEIWPKAGLLGKVFSNLQRIQGQDFDLYLKDDIPERWHYKHHRRNSPLLLVAKEDIHVWKYKPERALLTADHGYDNELDSMRPFFVARGPAFKPKSRIKEPIGLENIYSLCCHLLHITPNANNGSVTPFESVLNY